MNRSNLIDDLKWVLRFETINEALDLSYYRIVDWEGKLQQLSDNPSPLYDVFSNVKSHFLGSYFEVLFSFAIRHFTTLDIVCEHEQIQSDTRTLGEIDLIVKTVEGHYIQFEIAIKFYLERPDLAPDNWIGPNKNDSLRKKTERAMHHQLKILNTKEGVAWLNSHSIPNVGNKELLIFGRLFRYPRMDQSYNSEANWIHLRDLDATALPLLAEAIKPHWLTPTLDMEYITHRECSRRLTARFEIDDRPVLFTVSSDKSAKIGHKWLFVVPDEW
ncbi:DUF1853 family protein [Marinomonas balearica]|uniref:DUF1853 family protein n=1 Tax=Marinomonas balearica TaxID=491947 RepID=A0A4R6MC66_9GAMM|nr:DUF1853 family protein [Marinomonas balearica]TDO99074.1 hypothetical protein DFP79_1500 [Marinomonas balearica]